MIEVRRATPGDLDALASLRPSVHDKLARDLGLGIVELDVYVFNPEARAFFISQGFAPQRERLSRVLA